MSLVSAAAEYAGKLVTGEGFVTKYKPASKTYADKFNDKVLPAVSKGVDFLEKEFQKIVYSHDIETTLKAAGLSYVLYKITSWFSFFTILTTAVILLFTFPFIYTKYKKEIDAAVAHFSKLAKDKSSEYTKLASDKAAPHVEKLVEKSGPVGAFVKSKLPKTRTAGSTVGDDKSTSAPEPSTKSTGSSGPEPSTAKTTGSSAFPEVPKSATKDDSTFEDLVDEGKSAAAGKVPDTTK